MPDNNNSKVGFTFQKTICDMYGIIPESETARSFFETNYDPVLSDQFRPVIIKAFSELGLKPKMCHTFEKIGNRLVPFNFTLEDNSTLSVRTTTNKDKVAPREVGQAGFEKLNDYFSGIYGKQITSQDDIKHLFTKSIDKALPVFIDNLMDADHILWIHFEKTGIEYDLFDGNGSFNLKLDRSHFTFTRDYDDWLESTTLKYDGQSIAEIQIHKNRTFKFRFNLRNMLPLLKANKVNNETLGITAELLICGEFDLEYPSEFRERYSANIAIGLRPAVREAFRQLPKPVEYTGKDSGSRGGSSKCPYDFILEGGKTLSLKTNYGKMVCPPEVGQPGAETCLMYFKDYLDGNQVTEDSFKRMVFNHIADIIPIYVSHLFDSDYLLRIKESDSKRKAYSFTITEKAKGSTFEWNPELFSFTKGTIEEWNESNTVRYNGTTLGEFQVHKHRNCYKFRFNFDNLLSILK